jgi:hypothetical protein
MTTQIRFHFWNKTLIVHQKIEKTSSGFVHRILNINKGMTVPILEQMRVSSFFHASSMNNK